MNLSELKTGDLIVRAKGIFSTHYMVYIENRRGTIIVAENQNGFGVRYVTLAAALNGNSIVRFEKFGGTDDERATVVGRINSILGKSYDLIAFNCEHFARLIAHGKPKSKQIETSSSIAIVAGLGMMNSKNRQVQSLGFASLVLGMIGKITQP